MSFTFFVFPSSAQRLGEEGAVAGKDTQSKYGIDSVRLVTNSSSDNGYNLTTEKRFLGQYSVDDTVKEPNVCDLMCADNPFLQSIQLSNVTLDSKEFVDRPLLASPKEILEEFKNLPNNDESISTFLKTYFGPAGSELNRWGPRDAPKLIKRINDDYTSTNSETLKPTSSIKLLGSYVDHSSLFFDSFSLALPIQGIDDPRYFADLSHIENNLSNSVSFEKLSLEDDFLLQKAFELYYDLGRQSKNSVTAYQSYVRRVLILRKEDRISREEEEREISKCLNDNDFVDFKVFNLTEYLASVSSFENSNTFINVPYGFIVPGGRFREAYYWDSYWIVRGLLISKMNGTAKGIIRNFCYLIDKFGFVPNGLRLYYLDRSQPPVLSLMVYDYITATRDYDFVHEVYSFLVKEYSFWMNQKSRSVCFAYDEKSDKFEAISHEECKKVNKIKRGEYDKIVTSNENRGNNTDPSDVESAKQDLKTNATSKIDIYVLNVYGSSSMDPRPESYREDYLLASCFSTKEEKDKILNSVRAAAESGWDFSSRWFNWKNQNNPSIDTSCLKNRKSMINLETTNVVPIDLNSLLYHTETLLANLSTIKFLDYPRLGRSNYNKYSDAAKKRLFIMKKLMYNKEKNTWLDYLLNEKRQSDVLSAASIWPLYLHLENDYNREEYLRSVKMFVDSPLWGKYGLMSTTVKTEEQWDYENSWPPLLQMAVRVALLSEDEDVRKRGIQMCENFLSSVYQLASSHGVLFEKYNSNTGDKGDGGEYDLQVGFGWTVGVVIEFIMYKSADYAPDKIRHIFAS